MCVDIQKMIDIFKEVTNMEYIQILDVFPQNMDSVISFPRASLSHLLDIEKRDLL